MIRLISFVLSSLMMASAFAQTPVSRASIPTVDRDGFYEILLTPELAPFVNESFSNIRLVDEKNTEIPYLLNVDEGRSSSTSFIQYPVEEKRVLPDSCTIVVLSNAANTVMNNISLQIRNAEVSKEASLAGSDDKQTWYALKHCFPLEYFDNANGTATVRVINFPNSNYRYYRLWIDDKTSAPLNVLAAGYYEVTPGAEPRYTTLPRFPSTQSDDGVRKISVVESKFDTAYFVDKITWRVSGFPFYQRSARLYSISKRIDRKGREEEYRELITTFQINSRHQNVLFIPALKTDNLIIEVDNLDNPALVIDSLQSYQLNRSLLVYLKKGTQYKLNFGDRQMLKPVYDLAFFRDSIPSRIPVLNPGRVELDVPKTEAAESTFFTSNTFIWAALIGVIVVLGFMSVKMVRDSTARDHR